MPQDDRAPGYVHGYGSASQTMSVRTAGNFATFFTPYLEHGMRLLDVGCGPGTISVGLAELVSPGGFVGIDIGQQEIERAKANAVGAGVANAEFLVADATKLPFADGEFDVVFSCAALEHVPDVHTAVSEIQRVLKLGGIVSLKGGSPSRQLSFPNTGVREEVAAIYGPIWEHLGGHPEFGAEQADVLQAAGFEVMSVTGMFEARAASGDYADRITSERFVKQATELNLATRRDLESLAERIRSRASIPGATSLIAWIEVVARKPE